MSYGVGTVFKGPSEGVDGNLAEEAYGKSSVMCALFKQPNNFLACEEGGFEGKTAHLAF